MKTSTDFAGVANGFDEETAVELLAKAGFDCWDFSMFDMVQNYDANQNKYCGTRTDFVNRDYALRLAEKLKKIGLKNGITCNQAHAPFPVYNTKLLETLPVSIEAAAVAGAKSIIIHPDNFKSAAENAVMYRELLPYAHKFGIKIATENMWCWADGHATVAACSHPQDFVDHVDIVGDDFLGACVDIGHAYMFPDVGAPALLEALGQRVIALHVHDNDLVHDNHAVPYTMSVNFDEVIGSLKKIGYKGDMTLECSGTCDQFKTYDNRLSHLKEMATVARKLAEAVEG